MNLTRADKDELKALEGQAQYLRSCVQSVVEGYDCGLFVYGEGGIGKSFTVEQELTRLNAQYVLHNTRLTAKGLVVQLEEKPHVIHWIEDAEDALKQPHIDGLLRSATYSQDDRRHSLRRITWTLGKNSYDIGFTGGIIIVSNQQPDRTSGIARALGTRFHTIDFSITQPQMLAMMKSMCQNGFVLSSRPQDQLDDDTERDPWDVVELDADITTMTPEECWEVVEFVQKGLAELKTPLSLRLIKQGWRDYLYAANHPDQISWQDKLRGRMTEKPSGKYRSRKEMVAVESEIARNIHGRDISYAEKVREWHAATGKSPAAYDRALKR